MSNFAKNQLLKYGWTEGKGLGKNENGMVEAIKPQLKFDTTGIGHDRSEYNWWEHVYNKASSNVEVKKSESSEIKLQIKDTDAVEIATSKSELTLRKLKKDRSLHFGSFIKTSTLQDGKNVEDENRVSFDATETMGKIPVLTDEEIFKACGGRTAHKGARHGLKLTGKLARIERQERELMMGRVEENETDWMKVEKKKKKRKHERMDLETSENDEISEAFSNNSGECSNNIFNNNNNNYYDDNSNNNNNNDDITEEALAEQERERKKSKKAKRKEKRKLEDLTHKLTTLEVSEDSHEDKKQKKKSKKSHKEEPERKRRKKMHVEVAEGNNNNMADLNPENFAHVVPDPGCNDDGFVSGGSGDNSSEVWTRTFKLARGLNHKIKKKKKKDYERKERKKLEKLTEELGTLELASASGSIVYVSEKHKEEKKKKKSKKDG